MNRCATASTLACCCLSLWTLELLAQSHLAVMKTDRDGAGAVVTCLAVQPGGPWLATGGDDHDIRLWDATNGRLMHRWQGHHDWVQDLRFSPDGAHLVSTGKDGLIVVWDLLAAGKPRIVAHRPYAMQSLDFDAEGRYLAVAGSNCHIDLYETATWRALPQADHRMPCGEVRCIRFSPTGDYIAACARKGAVELWKSPERGTQTYALGPDNQRSRCLAFSWAGDWLAAGGEDRQVRLWYLGHLSENNPPTMTIPLGNTKAFSLAFVGKQLLAVGGSDNRIQIWDLAKQERVRELHGHTGSVSTLAFTGQRLISGSFDTTLRFWTDPLFESTVDPLARVKVATNQEP